MEETIDLVRRSLSASAREEFDRRVEVGAAYLREELDSGSLENRDAALGMELELYAVDGEGRLTTLPEEVVEDAPVAGELGLHNVEINTDPTVLDDGGIEAQAKSIRDRFEAAQEAATESGRRFVPDGMWTIPPEGGTREYLSKTREVDGVTIAENMHESPRYYALDNDILRHADGEVGIDLPGVEATFPSILVESLTTSIQPHLQIPDVDSFPAHYNAAIRTLGPVLALATNSPFLPADLYGETDAREVLDSTHHELRIPVFEQSINAGQEEGKVRFPRDVDRTADAIDRIVADATLVPFLREWVDGDGEDEDGSDYTDDFWEFDHKHGTYWRWLRGVIGGDPIDADNDERSIRIEYRPLPTQPSVRDVVGFQCLVGGLIRGLALADHPLADLDWELARESFYAVVEDGLDAELHWVTSEGAHTTEKSRIYAEVFDYARRGLREHGVDRGRIETRLRPIERRWEERTTPSRWKVEQVRERVEAGAPLDEAIEAMQREYAERAGSGEPFVEWP